MQRAQSLSSFKAMFIRPKRETKTVIATNIFSHGASVCNKLQMSTDSVFAFIGSILFFSCFKKISYKHLDV